MNQCQQMKIVRQLIEQHRLNLSSYASILTSSYLQKLEQFIREFPTSKDKISTLVNIMTQIAKGHQAFIVETCKQQCQHTPPYCITWDISVETTFSGEVQEDISNDSNAQIHDLLVHLDYKIHHNILVYKELLMISLDNFVGQLGGLIGLYIGWSFVSVAVVLLKRLPALFRTGEFKWKWINITNNQRNVKMVCEKCNQHEITCKSTI